MKYFNCETCGIESPNIWRRASARFCSSLCASKQLVKLRHISKPEVKHFSGNTRLIDGKYIVNEEYYDWLDQWSWYTSSTGYAVHRNTYDGKRVTVRMHREIIDVPQGLVVDHVNRNKFDNTVANLRAVTQAVNAANGSGNFTKPVYEDLPKHVTFDKTRNKFMTKKPMQRRFDTLEEAVAFVGVGL